MKLAPESSAALVAVSAPIIHGPTPAEEAEARQKARFVLDVFNLATSGSALRLQEACTLVASRAQQDFPALLTAGQGRKTALGDKTAWPNYRQWARKLGTVFGGRKPEVENWRELLPKYRGSRTYERPGADLFWSMVHHIYANQAKKSLSDSYHFTRMAWLKKGGSAQEMPTLSQCQHFYNTKYDRKALLMARNGTEWCDNHLFGYTLREAARPTECWFGDHHQFDVAIKVWNEKDGKWEAVRPWLTSWLDWGSLSLPGWIIRAIDPNRDAIERAFRSGINKSSQRPPVEIYIDNGKDYHAALGTGCFTDEDEKRFGLICQTLGIHARFALPYNARAKVIERFHKEVCEFSKSLFQFYLGNSPQTRPDYAPDMWKKTPEKLPTLEEFTLLFGQWLEQVYHERPSQGDILKGKTPREALLAAVPLREAVSAQQIEKAFLRELPGPRTIRTGGVVRGDNRLYKNMDLYRLLENVKQIRVRVDPDDVSKAWAYALDGREICPLKEVVRVPGLAKTPESIEEFRRQMRERASYRKELKLVAKNYATAYGKPAPAFAFTQHPRQLSAHAAQPAAAVETATAAAVAEIDDVLRAETAARLEYCTAPDLDAGDEELLARLEREQAERCG